MRNKGEKKKVTRAKQRIAPVFIGVLFFIILVMSVIYLQVAKFKTRMINVYNDGQSQIVAILGNDIQKAQAEGATTEDIINIINSKITPSGSRFVVYERNDEILFAKTTLATSNLKGLRYSPDYWQSINEQEIEVSEYLWNTESGAYKVSIVTEQSVILDGYSVNQVSYYIFFVTAIMCLVLFILIIIYVTMLDSTTKSLSSTQNELEIKTIGFENYIAEDKENPNNVIHNETDFEASFSRLERFFDVSFLRNLLSKSNEEDLKPIKIVFISFLMTERYYSANEIVEFASSLTRIMHQREAIFEVRKGLFAVVIFKSNDAEVKIRTENFKEILEKKNKEKPIFRGFDFKSYPLGVVDAPIVEFERILESI